MTTNRSSPVRIGFRVLSNPAWLGGVNYVLNWAKAFNALGPGERPQIYFLFADSSGETIARQHANLAVGIEPFDNAGRLELDMVYPVTQIFEAPFDAPWAAWIPDWQCKHMPEMFDELEWMRRDVHYRLLATRAPLLVVSSQMAYEDTCRIVGDSTVPIVKLHFPAVIEKQSLYLSAYGSGAVLRKMGLPDRFFLVCNQFWKHKNHIVVLRALARLSDLNVTCVFTGDFNDHRWPEYFQELRDVIAVHKLEPRVRLLGSIPREEQLQLMAAATCIIQPSLFEGWSTVVEEAKALSKRLLLSDIPVHREQAPKNARFFEPTNDEQLAELMRELWSDSVSHSAENTAGNGVAEHNDYVRDCARKFLEVAETVRAHFNAERHDPTVIMTDLLASLHESSWNDKIKGGIYRRALGATRSMFIRKPEKLPRLVELVVDRAPRYLSELKQQIVDSVLVELHGPIRDRVAARMRDVTPEKGHGRSYRLRGRIQHLLRKLRDVCGGQD